MVGFPADRLPGILFLIAVMNSGVTVRAGRIGMFSEETALMCDARAAGVLPAGACCRFSEQAIFCGWLYADGFLCIAALPGVIPVLRRGGCRNNGEGKVRRNICLSTAGIRIGLTNFRCVVRSAFFRMRSCLARGRCENAGSGAAEE